MGSRQARHLARGVARPGRPEPRADRGLRSVRRTGRKGHRGIHAADPPRRRYASAEAGEALPPLRGAVQRPGRGRRDHRDSGSLAFAHHGGGRAGGQARVLREVHDPHRGRGVADGGRGEERGDRVPARTPESPDGKSRKGARGRREGHPRADHTGRNDDEPERQVGRLGVGHPRGWQPADDRLGTVPGGGGEQGPVQP